MQEPREETRVHAREREGKHTGVMTMPSSVAAAKIDVFAKNGYNKCNKFRKIMKIIT